MRKIHEILRLRFEVGLSFRQISQCADVSTGAIQKMLKRLEASGISWPLPEGMSEPRLASMLYRRYEEGRLVDCVDDSLEYDDEDEHGWSDVIGPDWLLGNVAHYGG
ncbi:hypothetical protein AV650_28160 (plasmid) [Serratia fonticola]|uniref:hypothetical protein n=1 Tax=Serratia sp. 14-2641 TaxID=1841657 RepID=UPI000742EF08|nr:hypothetical protein [Serratia sp. 14-2641]ALX97435.1 hypothetical protein AV650_28160 [Serratia fonticola]OCJ33695.1 hypothetical protein A6U95_26270 [Serratia sp. 14-2641]